ncbi:hypothetical protein MHYP_G00301730 [Metynnis hypsauchen]
MGFSPNKGREHHSGRGLQVGSGCRGEREPAPGGVWNRIKHQSQHLAHRIIWRLVERLISSSLRCLWQRLCLCGSPSFTT